MNYEYHFFHPGSTESKVAMIPTTEPLPGIQVGHSLLLQTDEFSQTAGYQLEIRHVEVYLFAPVENAPPTKVRIYVYSVGKDRKAVQESLND